MAQRHDDEQPEPREHTQKAHRMPTLIEQRSYDNYKREKDNILVEDDSRPSESSKTNELSNDRKERRPKSQRSRERNDRMKRSST